jgi:hypothetical protein
MGLFSTEAVFSSATQGGVRHRDYICENDQALTGTVPPTNDDNG